MGGFGLLPGSTPPPTELNQVDVPLPSFRSIGEQAAAGAKDAGFFSGLWDAVTDKLADWAARILAVLLGTFARLGAWWARNIMAAEDKSDPAFAALASAAIKDLLGIDVPIAAGGPGVSGNRNAGAANSIGSAVLKGVFGSFDPSGSVTMQPGRAAAEKLLSTAFQLHLEGWLEGWIFEAMSLGALEKFADLDDKLAAAIGLPGMVSRVMGPVADVLIGTPFEWEVNRTFRPKLLSPRQCMIQLRRGRMTPELAKRELALQGYSDERIEALIATEGKHLSESELDFLIARGHWTRDQAIAELTVQGWSKEIAAALLQIQEDRRLDTYRRQLAETASTHYIARDIEADQFRQILDTCGLPERERDMVRIISAVRRELRVKQLTTSEVEQCVKVGILTLNNFRNHLRDQGYSFEDQRTLELLLLSEVKNTQDAKAAREQITKEREAARQAKEAAAQARKQQVDQQLKTKSLSLAQMERAVRDGLRTLEEYKLFLAKAGYTSTDQETLAGLLAGEIDATRQQEARRDELRRQAAVKHVALSDVENAVKSGILTLGEYNQWLADQGYADEDRGLLVNLLQAELDTAAQKAQEREAARARLAERNLSLSDVERAVRRGLQTVDQYRVFLLYNGFDPDEAAVLVGLVQSDIDADAAAREAKEAASTKASRKGLSIADLERAVRAGVRTMQDYRSALAGAGFSADDMDALQRLLQLDLDNDAATRKAKEAATAAAAKKRISLADVERAVKLGVAPIALYQDAELRAGIVAEDRALLEASLLAEIKAATEAKATRAAGQTQLARRGLSLAQFEQAVRDGVRNIVEYGQFLDAQGFSQADRTTLVALLALELQQGAAAKQRRAEIEAELAVRKLSLAQFEKAVLEGVRPFQDYLSFLRAQGYAELDVNTLGSLLSLAMDAAAAKAAAAAAKPGF